MSNLILLSIFCFVTAVVSEEMAPPQNTRIGWGDTKGDHFTARWSRVDDAASYNVFCYEGLGMKPMGGPYNVKETSFTVTGLKVHHIYGVRVQCVSPDGKTSPLSKPARTMTFGPTTTTTAPPPTAPVPVGSCGLGYFTCGTNAQCVKENFWCDYDKDCNDGTDEKNCPGSCPEIVSFSKHGNFSCTRWNSPKSFCFFQCNGDYVRQGAYYFMCASGKWKFPVPTCILQRPRLTALDDKSTTSDVQLLFGNLDTAVDFSLTSIQEFESGAKVEDATTKWDKENGFVTLTIGNLKPDMAYKVTVAYVDADGVVGAKSMPVKVKTAADEPLP